MKESRRRRWQPDEWTIWTGWGFVGNSSVNPFLFLADTEGTGWRRLLRRHEILFRRRDGVKFSNGEMWPKYRY